MQILENHSLKKLNTFGLDVRARYFAEVSSAGELHKVFSQYPPETTPHLILGGGSNLLFTGDFPGLVIKVSIHGVDILNETEEQVLVRAAAGEDWDGFVGYCVAMGWGGLENLSLIPGQAGSSPIQNIGAYGVELKDHFYQLDAWDKMTGNRVTFSREACRFGYRDSIFKREGRNRYVILSVSFWLTKKNHRLQLGYGAIQSGLQQGNITAPTIADVREVVCSIRRSKLPDPAVTGNAGSFFKNPVIGQKQFEGLKQEFPAIVAFPDPAGVKLAAGWLIEQAGWKGYREGDAGIHPLQALVLVNYGQATGKDLLALSEKVKASVLQQFGVRLETEVNIV
ncbi:MAG: UDP-N-acetylmuramate dehydrogenase [Bacteroides sp.]|jgi:UDP-N-acetylmuramate dehydrogenase|nr:UDP-N-acetylmuramate dehydrogenase [Bacteroides sp.]